MYPFSTELITNRDGESVVYNFAFGSNLLQEKMTSRGIAPLNACKAILHDWELTFNQLGFPPVEPSFANVVRNEGSSTHGILYELTVKDFVVLWRGEGSGQWYDTELVTARGYDGTTYQNTVVFTCKHSKLTKNGKSSPPSARYMKMLLDGAAEVGLSDEYQKKLNSMPISPHPSALAQYLFKGQIYFHNWASKAHESLPQFLANIVQWYDDKTGELIHIVAKRTIGSTLGSIVVPLLMLPGSIMCVSIKAALAIKSITRKLILQE